jgi:hypothetical protein
MKHLSICILSCLAPAVAVAATDSLTVVDREVEALRPAHSTFAQSFDNPAVKQWMLPVSHSTIAVAYEHSKQSQAVDPQLGDGTNVASFDADAYIKHGSSTLWGRAYYHNGKQYNIECNETSDANLIYPYFTTDEIGGDMNLEQYYFAGGFADTRGRIAWGGTLSYLAGLYYRNVDPRPRNVTGCLDASLGVAYRTVSDYFVGASANFRKYKQSNDIEFVSEMGSSIIYHATGLGTHYYRFAGTGDAAYYNGYRYGITANIYPASGSGFIASVGMSRFTFKKILTDLNRLPLNDVWHNQLTAQLGYSLTSGTHTAQVAANYDVYRRHGKENIFGDAATSIYPQIGYLEMYADNYYAFSLQGLYEYRDAKNRLLSVAPKVGYSHDRQVYADPRRDWLLNKVDAAVTVNGAISPAKKWLVAAELQYELSAPLSSSALVVTGETVSELSLIDVLQRSFTYQANNQHRYGIGASATRALNTRYALQLLLNYARTQCTNSVHANTIISSIKLIF